MTEPAYKPVNKCKTVSELLADPKRWCQGSWAQDASDSMVNIHSPAAVKWCLLGAIRRVYGYCGSPDTELSKAGLDCIELARGVANTRWLLAWNDYDHRSHAEVLALAHQAGI